MAAQPPEDAARSMRALLLRLAPHEGYTQSLHEGVRFMRANQPVARTPVFYEPSIVILCQGRKRGYLGDKVYHYDAQHYLVASVPLPFSSETDATPAHPMLGVSIRLDMAAVAQLVMVLAEAGRHPAAAPEGIVSTPLDAQVLAPAIVQELCFRVLMGEQGGALRAALGQQGPFGRVARVLRRIHVDYAQPMEVGHLARDAGLSVAAFHNHFKTVTRSSPIQYIKSIRLHQARLMMVRDSVTAAAAAARVGYESPSQFNREFKRLFGRSPGEEARSMKSLLALLPPAPWPAAGLGL